LGRGAVEDLYEIINSLNAHRHSSFQTIAFSDTLLVYNTFDPLKKDDRQYVVMFMCEFAQDLFYRLVGKDLYFRAYLTKGEFVHKKLDNMEAFYGEALVRAYRHEKTIESTGLFIDRSLLPDCDIFRCEPYDDDCCFVHLMQSLDELRCWASGDYPIPVDMIEATGAEWFLAYNIKYLANVYRHMNNVSLSPRTRTKHASAWHMIRRRHKALLDVLEANDFNPRCISELDWSEPMRRVGTPDGFFG
jgi:hypothetical protein